MFRIIGLVIGLIAIRILMSDVFHAFEGAAISFFNLLQNIFTFAPNTIGTQLGGVGAVGGMNYVPQTAMLPNYILEGQ